MLLTLVPDARSFSSRLSPAGTSILLRVIVEHDLALSLAWEAEVKVQEEEAFLVKLETREGPLGRADATEAPRASIEMIDVRILKGCLINRQETRVKAKLARMKENKRKECHQKEGLIERMCFSGDAEAI